MTKVISDQGKSEWSTAEEVRMEPKPSPTQLQDSDGFISENSLGQESKRRSGGSNALQLSRKEPPRLREPKHRTAVKLSGQAPQSVG